MAEAAAAEVTQEKDDVCSVCRDPSTRDPRLLDCGHHFCLSCLDKLVAKKTITCPNCRYITLVNTGVEGLAWYRTTNPFTENVTQASNPTENTKMTQTVLCDACVVDVKKATESCVKCNYNLCDDCGVKHKSLEEALSHKLISISAYMVCAQHTNRVVHFSCLTCNTMCCIHCVTGDHSTHELEEINAMAEKSRHRLQQVKREIIIAQEDEQSRDHINYVLMKAKKVNDTFETSIKIIKSRLTNISAKLDMVTEEVSTKMAATIKTLEMMSSDIGDYLTSKNSLGELLTYLIEGASSPEVVTREKELPNYDTKMYRKVIRETEVELAEISNLCEIKSILDQCQQNLNIAFTKHSMCGPGYDITPLSILQRVTTIQASAGTWGLAVDSGRERLIVRTDDASCPISVYNFQGQRLRVLGQGVEGITHASRQGIAIDNKRDVYVLPVNNGSLVTMDTNGNVKEKFKVTSSDCLEGISYTEDFYITCRGWKSNEVYLVNPETKMAVMTFSPNTTFSRPCNVTSGLCSITEELKCAYIVSNRETNCVKLLDSSGRLLHTYGKEEEDGQGEGELLNPWGVCTDPGGRIIVCDQNNHRVVAYWQEDGKDRWETLLGTVTLGNKQRPLHVTCDPVSRKLFIGYLDGTIYVYK